MTTPIKIGIAVSCFVAVAILIAVGMGERRRKDDAGPTPSAPGTFVAVPPPALPSPELSARKAPEEVIVCPQLPSNDQGARKTLVPPKGETPDSSSAEKPEIQRVYTVVQGDSLYGISVKVFGTPRHYARIYEMNRDRIKDPNTLQVGINLRMPDPASKQPTNTSAAIPPH